MPQNVCGLSVNPDVSGIGVRTAMYVQALLGIVGCSVFADRKFRAACIRNSSITSLATVCTLLIQLRSSGDVSLVDALVVSMMSILVLLSGIFIIVIYALRYGFRKRDRGLYIIYLANSSASVLVTDLMCARITSFASNASCRDVNTTVKFVVAGKSVLVTNRSLRIFALTFSSVLLFVAFLASAGLPLLSTLRVLQRRDEVDIITWRFWVMCCQLGGAIYMIVTTEQVLSRNNLQHQTHQWSFGQTLALIMLIQPLSDIFYAIWRN
ncbi:hypothetical protein JAAARDRAFT_584350 [Jaapia argillacea MUCL 33604]|uniref:Uncharacterized protein n=1 Tax=Jaapia argillacea MUCL 33604 TaxID=933084 RepID=A0A067PHD1_9AGAM|nr:hypothetical protein JAAARDRAFT_584350 [Jaapia argillacea MUCL 33604]